MSEVESSTEVKEAISAGRAKKQSGAGCLVVFFGLFLAVGCAACYFMAVRPLLNVNAARGWIETPCTILSSEVATHHGDDSDTYSVKIAYRYEFNNVPHESDRYDFMVGSTGGRNAKQEIVDRHQPGTQTVCFVDPQDPRQAVLHRGLPQGIWLACIPLVFVLVGLGGVVFTVRSILKRPSPSDNNSSVTTETSSLGSAAALSPRTADFSPGPVTLKPESSAGMKLVVAIVIAIFWNGIVSVFLGFAVFDPPAGFMRWFILLLLTPFVLIGLLLIYNVFHTFLALFNPRPTLVASSTLIQLGFPLEVSWQFSGPAASISRLRIYLEGKESARYTRGTSTYTDTSVFAELSIVDTTDRAQIPQGKAEVTIPFNTMHSWDGGNNKIEWRLRVIGEIKRWPDVDDSYPVQVFAVVLS